MITHKKKHFQLNQLNQFSFSPQRTPPTVRAPNILLLVVMRSFMSDSGVFLKQLPICAIKRLKIWLDIFKKLCDPSSYRSISYRKDITLTGARKHDLVSSVIYSFRVTYWINRTSISITISLKSAVGIRERWRSDKGASPKFRIGCRWSNIQILDIRETEVQAQIFWENCRKQESKGIVHYPSM